MDGQQSNQPQPGQIISPQTGDIPTVPVSVPVPEPTPGPTPLPSPTSLNEPVVSTMPLSEEPEATPEPVSNDNWAYHEETSSAQPNDVPEQLSWTAAEFVSHDKGTKWYVALIATGVVAAALDFLVARDLLSTIIILVATLMLGLYASRKPREQRYALDRSGIWVGDKVYDFQSYKTFSVVDEGAAASIIFMPLKRFMPPLTIYVSPDVEDGVVDFLADFLPFEQHKADIIDTLMRRIRF
jgi:hypothetical protein